MASCTEPCRRDRRRRHWLAAALVGLWLLTPAGGAAPADDDRVLLEVETNPASDPYVGARLVYRLRVVARVPLRQATLSDPGVIGATVQRLGDDRRWSEPRGDARYSVLERRWAIVPERDGPLVIDGPTLAAAVPAAGSAGDGREGAGLIERLETLHQQAATIRLVVQPPPTGAEAPWLPAEAVSISERWEPAADEVHVGVPLTRTVVVEAVGVLPTQLPALALTDAPGFKVYPETAVRDQHPAGDDLLARLTQRISYVPVAPGRFEIPPLRLPWWNLGLDAPRQALLAGRTLRVAGPTATGDGAVGAPPAGAGAGPGDRIAQGVADSGRSGTWIWPATAALFATLWAATLWRCARRSRRAAPDQPDAHPAGPRRASAAITPALAAQRFQVACRAADARAARAALLAFGAARWPQRPPRGLDELMTALAASPAIRAHAATIDGALYGAAAGAWAPAAAAGAIGPLLRAATDHTGSAGEGAAAGDALPALYPRWVADDGVTGSPRR